MKRLAELGAEVSASLEEARTRGDAMSRVRAKIVAREVPHLRATRHRRRAYPNLRLGAAAALALAAAIALTAFFAWPHKPLEAQGVEAESPPSLSFIVGEGSHELPGATGAFIAAPEAAETRVQFSDGSTLRLAPDARLRVAEVARNGARVLVESGTVHVSVVHRDDTRWSVAAGPFEVQVTGTQFDVVYDPASSSLAVRMTEGSVVVHGCGLLGAEGRRLTTGEQLEVSCKDKTSSASAPDTSPDDTATPDGEQTRSKASTPSTVRPAEPSPSAQPTVRTSKSERIDTSRSVVDLARKGSHAEAMTAAEANGFDTTCAALSGPELLLLGDAARYAGRFDRATEALEIARRRFAGSDAAATAAFELGRIAMDVRRELTVAGDHFETYLRERPTGSLAREALGRAIEARSRAGDSARAERLAVRYLAAYPDGPHAKLARKLSSADPDPRTP
ncbi:MAG: hypothetical protein BGO98_31450 [Myxococcales bacterium 68-20]|nr:MAG: hypothetical protein BGO98_31450 [Myxococcales bacterium 68-20]